MGSSTLGPLTYSHPKWCSYGWKAPHLPSMWCRMGQPKRPVARQPAYPGSNPGDRDGVFGSRGHNSAVFSAPPGPPRLFEATLAGGTRWWNPEVWLPAPSLSPGRPVPMVQHSCSFLQGSQVGPRPPNASQKAPATPGMRCFLEQDIF